MNPIEKIRLEQEKIAREKSAEMRRTRIYNIKWRISKFFENLLTAFIVVIWVLYTICAILLPFLIVALLAVILYKILPL